MVFVLDRILDLSRAFPDTNALSRLLSIVDCFLSSRLVVANCSTDAFLSDSFFAVLLAVMLNCFSKVVGRLIATLE